MMCDGVEVEVWMHGKQGCLVACVRTEPCTEKVVQTRQTQHIWCLSTEHTGHTGHRESTIRESGGNTTVSDSGWLFADEVSTK